MIIERKQIVCDDVKVLLDWRLITWVGLDFCGCDISVQRTLNSLQKYNILPKGVGLIQLLTKISVEKRMYLHKFYLCSQSSENYSVNLG